jgi:hypothetical protein
MTIYQEEMYQSVLEVTKGVGLIYCAAPWTKFIPFDIPCDMPAVIFFWRQDGKSIVAMSHQSLQ